MPLRFQLLPHEKLLVAHFLFGVKTLFSMVNTPQPLRFHNFLPFPRTEVFFGLSSFKIQVKKLVISLQLIVHLRRCFTIDRLIEGIKCGVQVFSHMLFSLLDSFKREFAGKFSGYIFALSGDTFFLFFLQIK